MENSVVKYSLKSRNEPKGSDPHWDYCCQRRIPYVTIRKSGTKYWKVDYNVLPVIMGKRFTVISFAYSVTPLYELYCAEHNFPCKKLQPGIDRLPPYEVYKADAENFAEKLFDLLKYLMVKDEELFNVNPFYINNDGYNCECFHVAGYMEELAQMSDIELNKEYKEMKKEKPYLLQTMQLIKNEMNKRKIVIG